MDIHKGDRITLRHWRNPETNGPLEGIVTRIAGGNVYYRAHYGQHDDGTPWLGSPSYFPAVLAERYVERVRSKTRNG